LTAAVRILLTNDDGIDSPGLHALAGSLSEVAEVVVVAPASNQSAVARSITIRRALNVSEAAVPGAVEAFALSGTPVDCVRFARLGLDGAFDLVVSGANIGHNLGDDVTYSGTVAAAFEGILLGIPSIAVSQGPAGGGTGFVHAGGFAFEAAARFVAGLAGRVMAQGLPDGTLLNVNVPHDPQGVAVTTLGRRIYADQLEILEDRGSERLVRIYGAVGHSHRLEPGSDFAAIEACLIAVTPLHFDLGLQAVTGHLASLRLEELV
jgi:5'-nucleotidase